MGMLDRLEFKSPTWKKLHKFSNSSADSHVHFGRIVQTQFNDIYKSWKIMVLKGYFSLKYFPQYLIKRQ